MKKVISTLLFFAIASFGFTQTTYYWVGGTTEGNISTAGNWNTQLNGGGTNRATAASTDVLIVDGTNIGGTTPTTGNAIINVNSATTAQLKVINGANVTLTRTATVGTLTIANNTSGEDGLFIDATSAITCTTTGSNTGAVYLDFPASTATIAGNLTFSQGAATPNSNRLTARMVGAIVFATSSTFEYDNTITYPFGTVSSGTPGTSNSVNAAIVFRSGANLINNSIYSPFGSSSTSMIVDFNPGSNYYIRKTMTTGSFTNLKTFGNLFIQNGAVATADGPSYKIENFTIDAGCTFRTHLTGNTPVLGNLVVNGILTYNTGATSNSLNMCGSSPQTISGSGVIDIISFSVGNYSDVTLQRSITVNNNINIVGKLTFAGTSQFLGAASFTSRAKGSAVDAIGNTTAGSFLVTGVSTTLSGNTALAVTCTTPGVLSPNTNCIGFGTGFIYLSKPALTNTTGVTFQFFSDSATLITSNPNGFNTSNGSIITTGTRSFQSGVNYIINAATTTPFGITTGNTTAIVGNVTLNAPVTTNSNVRVSGTLTLGNGKLTIRATDTLRMLTPTGIAGAPFSNTKYIALEKSGANVGALRIDGITSNAVFPIGSTTNYLPATITTTALDTFIVQAFEGITEEGSPNGTPMSALKKAKVVDAIWNFNRISNSNTSACGVTLGWPASLEGSSFSGFANNQIGISRNNGTAWEIVTGNGDNVANTVTTNFTAFSPFAIGEVGFILPVKLYNLSAKSEANNIRIKWQVEQEMNVEKYVIERSSNGYNFETITTVNATSNNQYSIIDATPLKLNYYRIKVIGKNGNVEVSNIISIRLNNTKSEISIFPNPVKGKLVNVQLSNMEMGKASIQVYNAFGQLITTQSFVYDGSNLLKSILLPTNAVKGIYTIVVETNDKTTVKKTFLVD